MDLTRRLIQHGTDASAQDIYKWTPLHCAVQKGRVDFARFLIERGADLAVEDNRRGRILLHLAVLEGSVAFAHFLIGHGADARARDDGGRSQCRKEAWTLCACSSCTAQTY